MYRSALVFLLSFSALSVVDAWTTGSAVSAFGGSVLITHKVTTPATTFSGPASLEMKKGKSNVPPMMRKQYERAKEMEAMRKQMLAAQKPGDDGIPVFNLFVRTSSAGIWYPVATFKGDERSGVLAKNYADGGFLAGISKKQLDSGIAGSLYRDLPKIKESIVRAFPQLNKSRDQFQFGYKLGVKGLSPEKSDEITLVEPKELKGFFDVIKYLFS